MKLYEILMGMGAILSIFPTGSAPQITRPNDGLSDNEALAQDWRNIGQDMRVAINEVQADVAETK